MLPLYVAVFIEWLGFGVVLPVLPFYAKDMGASPILITALVSTYAVTQLASAVLLGRISDRVGRKLMLSVCMGCGTLGMCWLALASSLPEIFAARAIGGIAGAAFPIANACVADQIPAGERPAAMGRLAACFGLAMGLGPALGSLITAESGLALGMRAPFALASILSALALLTTATALRERRAVRTAGSPSGRVRMAAVVLRPSILFALGIMFAIELSVSGLLATVPLFAEKRFHWGAPETGLLLFYFGVVICVCQGVLVGRVVRRAGELRVIQWSVGLLLTGFVMVEVVFRWELMLLCGGLMCVGVGLGIPALLSFTSSRTPTRRQGTALGALEAATSFSHVVGPLVAGAAFDALGAAWPSRASVVVLAAALVVAIASHRSLHRAAGGRIVAVPAPAR